MHHQKLNLVALLVLGSACCISAFYNDLPVFRSVIQPRCYNASNGHYLILGQDYPRAQTLDNFISLVEKFEQANPEIKLDDMLFIFLKNFTHENLIYREDSFVRNTPAIGRWANVEDLWEEDRTGPLPEHVNPFDDDESCSLFFMLSHTVNDTAMPEGEDGRSFSTPSPTEAPPPPPSPESRSLVKEGLARSDLKITKFPREQGIVLIRSTGETIALGQVLLGLYLGISGKERPLKDLMESKKPNNYVGDPEQMVYPLYIMTLSDTILMSRWTSFMVPRSKEIGGDAEAYGINNRDVSINTDLICPTMFQLTENATSMYTHSLFRGSTDGLLLGSIIDDIYSSPTGIRLSQVLRSYYSPQGIHVDALKNGVQTASFSSCQRMSLLEPFNDVVKGQMELLLAVISEDYPADERKLGSAWAEFERRRNEIFKHRTDICEKPITVETLPCETPVDVIVVLDTSNGEEELRLQQEIVGYMASSMDLWHNGSTITIYLDQLNASSTTDLEVLVPQTYSSACVACQVVQKEIPSSSLDRATVIQGIDKILDDKKKEVEDLSGTPGKVVVYFNFKDSEASDHRLIKVIGEIYRRHSDVPFIAVGKNDDVMKKYTGLNKFSLLRLIRNDGTKDLGHDLAQKICLGPASLQYYDCKLAKDEQNAIYEGYVTKSSVQHWGMDSKYFEKSYTAKLFFEATDGNIQVCHNRATTKPELVEKNCQKTNSSSRRLQFTEKNPCEGLSGYSCPAMYFSVIGIEPVPNGNGQANNDHACTDPECKSLNQVKFKFSHEGVRCSGCSALLSTTSLLFVSALLAFFFVAKDH